MGHDALMEKVYLRHTLSNVHAVFYCTRARRIAVQHISAMGDMGCFPRPDHPPVLILQAKGDDWPPGELLRKHQKVLAQAAKYAFHSSFLLRCMAHLFVSVHLAC